MASSVDISPVLPKPPGNGGDGEGDDAIPSVRKKSKGKRPELMVGEKWRRRKRKKSMGKARKGRRKIRSMVERDRQGEKGLCFVSSMVTMMKNKTMTIAK